MVSYCNYGPVIVYVGRRGWGIMAWARPIFFRVKGWAKREFHDDWAFKVENKLKAWKLYKHVLLGP